MKSNVKKTHKQEGISRSLKRGVSLLLSLLMFVGIFTALPLTAGATEEAWSYDSQTHTLYINSSISKSELDEYRLDVKNVVIADGVTGIGKCLFANCFNLETVTLPSTLKTLNVATFINCINLKHIDISNIISIPHECFMYCQSLKSIRIPDKCMVGHLAFFGCTNLTIDITSNLGADNIIRYWDYSCESNPYMCKITNKETQKVYYISKLVGVNSNVASTIKSQYNIEQIADLSDLGRNTNIDSIRQSKIDELELNINLKNQPCDGYWTNFLGAKQVVLYEDSRVVSMRNNSASTSSNYLLYEDLLTARQYYKAAVRSNYDTLKDIPVFDIPKIILKRHSNNKQSSSIISTGKKSFPKSTGGRINLSNTERGNITVNISKVDPNHDYDWALFYFNVSRERINGQWGNVIEELTNIFSETSYVDGCVELDTSSYDSENAGLIDSMILTAFKKGTAPQNLSDLPSNVITNYDSLIDYLNNLNTLIGKQQITLTAVPGLDANWFYCPPVWYSDLVSVEGLLDKSLLLTYGLSISNESFGIDCSLVKSAVQYDWLFVGVDSDNVVKERYEPFVFDYDKNKNITDYTGNQIWLATNGAKVNKEYNYYLIALEKGTSLGNDINDSSKYVAISDIIFYGDYYGYLDYNLGFNGIVTDIKDGKVSIKSKNNWPAYLYSDEVIENFIESQKTVSYYIMESMELSDAMDMKYADNIKLHLNGFQYDEYNNPVIDENGDLVDGNECYVTKNSNDKVCTISKNVTIMTPGEALSGILNDEGTLFDIKEGCSLRIENGTYSEDVSEYIANNQAIGKTGNRYTVYKTATKDMTLENDGHTFILDDVDNVAREDLLGVQIRPETDKISQGMRFVSAVRSDLLRGAKDYGFVLAKGKNVEALRSNKDNILADSGKCFKISAKNTSNSLADTAYSSSNLNEGKYKYLTAAITDIEDDNIGIGARLYIERQDGTYVYADYTCVSTMGEIKAMAA